MKRIGNSIKTGCIVAQSRCACFYFMEQEIWRPVSIEGYGKWYDVSNLGNVRSWHTLKSGLIKSEVPKSRYISYSNKYQYEFVALSKKLSKPVTFQIHFLVASAFVHNPKNRKYINHKNGNGGKELKTKWKTSANFVRAIAMGHRQIDDLDVRCKPCNNLHYLELKYGKLPYEIKWNDKDIIDC